MEPHKLIFIKTSQDFGMNDEIKTCNLFIFYKKYRKQSNRLTHKYCLKYGIIIILQQDENQNITMVFVQQNVSVMKFLLPRTDCNGCHFDLYIILCRRRVFYHVFYYSYTIFQTCNTTFNRRFFS